MPITAEERKRRRRVAVTKFEIAWNSRFNELILFKERFGHCIVPQNWSENKSLGMWVIHQRTHKKRLSPDHVSKLNSLGFVWNMPDYWWTQKYLELVKFKVKFGHCEVPKGKGPYMQLAEWVGKQRGDYKQKLKRLTTERIKILNDVGFYWGVRNTPWEERYKQLEAFKLHFGHCNVPQQWKENPPLGAWAVFQRKKHKQNKLLPHQFKLLDNLGFRW